MRTSRNPGSSGSRFQGLEKGASLLRIEKLAATTVFESFRVECGGADSSPDPTSHLIFLEG